MIKKTVTLDEVQWARVNMALEITIILSRDSIETPNPHRQIQEEIRKQREDQSGISCLLICKICGQEDDALNMLALPRDLYQLQESAHPACLRAVEKAKESEEEMEGQQYLWFPAQVNSMLTGDYLNTEPIVVPLFRGLSPEEEKQFRDSARESYVPGEAINEVYHPIWKDEARKMNAEVEKGEKE